MRKSRVDHARQKAWKAFSEWIRRKDADHNGYASCVTCGLRTHWKELHAGHFLPRARGNGLFFSERNVFPQCHYCNINLGGNLDAYKRYIELKQGPTAIDELRNLSHKIVKLTEQDFIEILEKYTEKIKALEKKRAS